MSLDDIIKKGYNTTSKIVNKIREGLSKPWLNITTQYVLWYGIGYLGAHLIAHDSPNTLNYLNMAAPAASALITYPQTKNIENNLERYAVQGAIVGLTGLLIGNTITSLSDANVLRKGYQALHEVISKATHLKEWESSTGAILAWLGLLASKVYKHRPKSERDSNNS